MPSGNTMTIGMDVSDKHCQIAVLDAGGAVVAAARVATEAGGIRRWFGRYPGARVVLEVGPHSPWLSRLLAELGHEVIVANPRKVALIHGQETKNDRVDAERLARLGRVDPALLSPVKHRKAETAEALRHLRARAALVKARTQLVNAVRAMAKAEGVVLRKSSTAAFHRQVDALGDGLREGLAPLMKSIESLSGQIAHYDRVVEDLAREVYPETEPLREIDGVGALTALCFVLTIEDPNRFSSSRTVGSYLGLRPRQDQSGETDKQLPITKAGDRMLRTYLVQAAHRILGPFGQDSDLRRWGLTLAARGGKAARKRATVAVARKLAVLLHHLWKTAQAYEPLLRAGQAAQDPALAQTSAA